MVRFKTSRGSIKKIKGRKMENNDLIEWLSNWYLNQCNGEWEHGYGIKIDTVDNPGFWVEIDLTETKFSHLSYSCNIDNSDTDWLFCKVKESKFIGSGDPTKLKDILSRFKTLIEENEEFIAI